MGVVNIVYVQNLCMVLLYIYLSILFYFFKIFLLQGILCIFGEYHICDQK